MYHLQLFKDNSDERKTLTKVSTRKPLTNIPQTKAHTSERENQEIVCKTRKLVKGPDTAKTSKKAVCRCRSCRHYKETTKLQVNQAVDASIDSTQAKPDQGLERVSNVSLNQNLGTLYNQDLFIADTTGRRLSRNTPQVKLPTSTP